MNFTINQSEPISKGMTTKSITPEKRWYEARVCTDVGYVLFYSQHSFPEDGSLIYCSAYYRSRSWHGTFRGSSTNHISHATRMAKEFARQVISQARTMDLPVPQI